MTAVLWHLSLQLFCDICLYGGSELLSNASLYLRQLILLLTVERWNWSWESMKKCEQNWKVWTMRSSETSITLQIMAMLLHNHKFQIVLKITWISWLSNFISNSRNIHQHFCILFQRFYNFFSILPSAAPFRHRSWLIFRHRHLRVQHEVGHTRLQLGRIELVPTDVNLAKDSLVGKRSRGWNAKPEIV